MALPKTCTPAHGPAAPFWGDSRPGMTPLQVRPHPGLSATSPGLPAWSKDQVPRVGRACCCHQPCPLPAWLYPASTMAPIAPLALLPVGPQLLARPTSSSPIDLPDSTAVTAPPGTSFLQLQAVASVHGTEETLEGLPAPKPAAFGCFAGPQHAVPQGQVTPTPQQLQVFPAVLLLVVPMGEPCKPQQQHPIAASILHQSSCWLLQMIFHIFNLPTFPKGGRTLPLAIHLLTAA